MAPWNRRFLLETIIFRFHVKLWEGIFGGFSFPLQTAQAPKTQLSKPPKGRRAKVQVALLHYRRDLVSRQTLGWDDFGGVLHLGSHEKKGPKRLFRVNIGDEIRTQLYGD